MLYLKICDCLRRDFLPECYLASTAIRERRRTLRYRNLLVRQMVQMKNKIGMLLMEAGVSYNKQRNPDIDEGLVSLLRLCRETVVCPQKTPKKAGSFEPTFVVGPSSESELGHELQDSSGSRRALEVSIRTAWR